MLWMELDLSGCSSSANTTTKSRSPRSLKAGLALNLIDGVFTRAKWGHYPVFLQTSWKGSSDYTRCNSEQQLWGMIVCLHMYSILGRVNHWPAYGKRSSALSGDNLWHCQLYTCGRQCCKCISTDFFPFCGHRCISAHAGRKKMSLLIVVMQ